MSRELDAAIEVANQMTREPKVIQAKKPTTAAAKVPVKAGAPAVRVDKSGHRVRLRNIDHALEGCISTRSGDERFRLEPDKWTVVSDAVYTMLRDKFNKPQDFDVVDWNGDLNNPRSQPRKESYQEYILEFPDERN